MTCHPLPTVAMTSALTTGARLTGRSGGDCALVAGTVLTGQLTVGWLNDLLDRDRDVRVGRRDKPLAAGRIDPGTVAAAIAGASTLVVPLSLANGRASGAAHLGAVASAWAYDLGLKRTALSWLPYAVSFGLLPAFLSYGGSTSGPAGAEARGAVDGHGHGGPPTVEMTALAALFGVGVHFLNTIPDLEEDERTGIRHLPLRVARRVGVRRLRALSIGLTAVTGAGMLAAGRTVGVARRSPEHDR